MQLTRPIRSPVIGNVSNINKENHNATNHKENSICLCIYFYYFKWLRIGSGSKRCKRYRAKENL